MSKMDFDSTQKICKEIAEMTNVSAEERMNMIFKHTSDLIRSCEYEKKDCILLNGNPKGIGITLKTYNILKTVVTRYVFRPTKSQEEEGLYSVGFQYIKKYNPPPAGKYTSRQEYEMWRNWMLIQNLQYQA